MTKKLKNVGMYINLDKISIIMPVYNSGRYIGKTLESIISQTYQCFEIICVDDGSTDRSPELLGRFASVDKRIKIITQKKEGTAKARNVGLYLATGDWITFVDSDDWLEPEMYEKLKY